MTNTLELREIATSRWGADNIIDASVGHPIGSSDNSVAEAISAFLKERDRYPKTEGYVGMSERANKWLISKYGIDAFRDLPGISFMPTIGSKHVMANIAGWLYSMKGLTGRRYVLVPELCYQTYELGAKQNLGENVEVVRVPSNPDGTMKLSSISDGVIEKTICLFVNSPRNPDGQVENLAAIAEWAKNNRVFVVSDECYNDFVSSEAEVDTMLNHMKSGGVLVVYSFSKTHCIAALRCGIAFGDVKLIDWIIKRLRISGVISAGTNQAGLAAVLSGDANSMLDAYEESISRMVQLLQSVGIQTEKHEAGIYLWIKGRPEAASNLAKHLGLVVSPGEMFGPAGKGYYRVACVVASEEMGILEARVDRMSYAGLF